METIVLWQECSPIHMALSIIHGELQYELVSVNTISSQRAIVSRFLFAMNYVRHQRLERHGGCPQVAAAVVVVRGEFPQAAVVVSVAGGAGSECQLVIGDHLQMLSAAASGNWQLPADAAGKGGGWQVATARRRHWQHWQQPILVGTLPILGSARVPPMCLQSCLPFSVLSFSVRWLSWESVTLGCKIHERMQRKLCWCCCPKAKLSLLILP